MKTFSLLCFLLIKSISGFFQRNKVNVNVNNLNYREDDWSHGEVEWDFPEKYTIYDKLKYTSLLENTSTDDFKNKENIYQKIDLNDTEDLNSNAIYYGIMKTINKEAVNFQEILLNIQNICFVKSDTNEDVSKDFYILILIYTLKANYELSKSRENSLLNKISDKKKYLKIKRIVSSIMLLIFTVLCRNVNGAE
jgi:hypothetical protein